MGLYSCHQPTVVKGIPLGTVVKSAVHTLLQGSPWDQAEARLQVPSHPHHASFASSSRFPRCSLSLSGKCSPNMQPHPCLAWSIFPGNQTQMPSNPWKMPLALRQACCPDTRGLSVDVIMPLSPITVKGRHTSHSPEHARKYPQVRFNDTELSVQFSSVQSLSRVRLFATP